ILRRQPPDDRTADHSAMTSHPDTSAQRMHRSAPPRGWRAAHQSDVSLHHLTDEIVQAGSVLPAKLLSCLAGIADDDVDLRRPEAARINRDAAGAGGSVIGLLIEPLAPPFEIDAGLGEGKRRE